MASVYIHVPFCKQACNYCNYHFSTKLEKKDLLINSLLKEIELRSNELKNNKVHSIYFGGGTPSILKKSIIKSLIDSVRQNFNLDKKIEICLEINPDDIKDGDIENYIEIGVNRISVGVQSFFDSDLSLMNRRHDSEQAINVIEKVKKNLKNYSIDLIYGIPNMTIEKWSKNLQTAISFSPPHISAYALTIEENTVFSDWVNKKKINLLSEEEVLHQFNFILKFLEKKGYDHYEISNFGKRNFYSKNNESYWLGESYIGIGPSAHSFDGKYRSWNISNNIKYINNIKLNKLPMRREKLSKNDKFNEYIMIGLRTIWGVSSKRVLNEFGKDYLSLIREKSKKHIKSSNLFWDGEILRISNKAKFLTDGIASDLFII
tara:strand:+ start:2335 stop:3459 length:1125 start_codon:yes stop_codon:yes gene_type:complete